MDEAAAPGSGATHGSAELRRGPSSLRIEARASAGEDSQEEAATASPTGRTIIVGVGTDSSGLGFLSKLLRSLGADFGSGPEEAEVAQDSTIGAFHAEVLAAIGRPVESFQHSLPFPAAWWRDRKVQSIKRRMLRTLERELGSAAGWVGFADPLTCRLLPLWWELFEALGLRPHYLWTIRAPADFASPTGIGTGQSVAQGEADLSWLVYNYDALRYLLDRDAVIIEHSEWLGDSQVLGGRLGRRLTALGIDIGAELSGRLAEIVADSPGRGARPTKLSATPIAEGLFGELARHARSDAAEIDEELGRYATLIDAMFQVMSPLTQVLSEVPQLRTDAREGREASTLLRKRTAEGQDREARLSASEAALAAAKSERDKLRGRLEAVEGELGAAKAELGSAKAELGAAKAELGAATVDLGAAKVELGAAKVELDAKNTELDAARADLDAANLELNATEAELGNAKVELGAKNAELGAANAELEEIRSQLAAASADAQALATKVKSHEQQIAEFVTDAQQAMVLNDAEQARLKGALSAERDRISRLELYTESMLSVYAVDKQAAEQRVAESDQALLSARRDKSEFTERVRLALQESEALTARLQQADRANEGLTAELKELTSLKEGLTAELQQTAAEKAVLKAKLQQARREHDEVSAELQRHKENFSASLQEANHHKNEFSQKLQQAERENADISEKLRQAIVDHEGLMAKLQQAKLESEALAKKLQHADGDRASLTTRLQQAEAKVGELNIACAGYLARVEDLKQRRGLFGR